MHPVTAYALDVIEKRITTGAPERQACIRHMHDLARAGQLNSSLRAKVRKATKKAVPADGPYNAAGFSRSGVQSLVRDEEYKRKGTTNYPWSDEIKAEMVEACNGLKTGADITLRIGEIASRAA